MRKLALFIAAGSLWLFLAALPALADGGVHIAGDNSGVNTLTADSCAGCHRAHTAQTSYLLKTSTEEALCLSCHGDSQLATTDVLNGVQYTYGTDVAPRGGTELGALRAGGFVTARIGAPNRVARSGYQASYGWTINQVGKVSVSTTDNTLTSSHMPGLSANLSTGTATPRAHVAWGSGVAGSGNGASFTLECTSCHNPHGNGAYAILNVGPMKTDTGATVAYQLSGVSVTAGGVFSYTSATGFSNGDKVTVAEAAAPSTVLYTGSVTIPVNFSDHGATVANPYQFTIDGVTSAGVSSTLIVTRSSGVKVDDWNTADVNSTRNYTVIQLGGNTSVLASSVGSYGATAGDYFRRYVPWNAPTTPSTAHLSDQPNGRATAVGQLNNWCAQCHTRYLTQTHTDTRLSDTAVVGSSTGFMYQHKTNGTGSSPSCNLCHVSHGSNVSMIGQAANVPFPNTQLYINADSSTDSRLLKIDNRGTCQQCHEPTGTAQGGAFSPSSIGTLVGNITSIGTDGTVTLAGGTVANDEYIVIQGSDATRTLNSASWSFNGAYFVINSTGSTFQVATTKGGAIVPALTAGTAVGSVTQITLSAP